MKGLVVFLVDVVAHTCTVRGVCATGLIESSRASKTDKQRQELDPNRTEHNHTGGFHGSPHAKS